MGGWGKGGEAAVVGRLAEVAGMGAKRGKLPLAYQRGTKWVYSLAMDVQGAIIEKLSGQTLPAFMQEKIFGPLGMADTAFHTPPEKKGRLATLYRTSKSRGLVALEGNPLLPDQERVPALA